MTVTESPRRRRRAPAETRRLIVEAGVAFLRERPYRELSVEHVMARTDLTRTLFYRHFADLSALMLAMIEQIGGELVAVASDWATGEEGGPEVAYRRLATFVEFNTRNAPLVRAVIEAAHHDDAVEAAYDAMVEAFVGITQRAIVARIAPGDPGIDADEVARALVRMLNGYLADPRRTQDPERALEAVWTVWTRTLRLDQPPASR